MRLAADCNVKYLTIIIKCRYFRTLLKRNLQFQCFTQKIHYNKNIFKLQYQYDYLFHCWCTMTVFDVDAWKLFFWLLQCVVSMKDFLSYIGQIKDALLGFQSVLPDLRDQHLKHSATCSYATKHYSHQKGLIPLSLRRFNSNFINKI